MYHIPCTNCDRCYIGETIRKLGKRLCEHKTDQKNALRKAATALASHVQQFGHQFDFNRTSILQQERTKRRLELQEVHQIIIHENQACNFKSDSAHISPVYFNLIKSVDKRITMRSINTTSDFDIRNVPDG